MRYNSQRGIDSAATGIVSFYSGNCLEKIENWGVGVGCGRQICVLVHRGHVPSACRMWTFGLGEQAAQSAIGLHNVLPSTVGSQRPTGRDRAKFTRSGIVSDG